MTRLLQRQATLRWAWVLLPIAVFQACVGTVLAAQPAALEEALYADLPKAVADFRQAVRSTDIGTYSQAALALRKWMIENDPHRPIYHFTGPESWINDPNGPIYFQGRYHLFYQFDPIVPEDRVGWRRSKRCWGHAVSEDLVHWVDWPVAVWPDTRYDRGGVYSGNSFVDEQGRLCAIYTGNVSGHGETYGMLVRSADGGRTFQKKMVMDNAQRPNAHSPVHWDGQVWKEGDTWCQLIGGCAVEGDLRGAAWLWKSTDLVHWKLQRNIAPSIRRAGFWELPYLIPLADKHVLLVGQGNPYWVGRYDRQAMLFQPDDDQPKSIDNGTYYSFNPNMTDDKGPGGSRRQLMHGWVTGPASPSKNVPYWQGAHSIPRVLALQGEHVVQQPIPEIERLRGAHRQWHDITVETGKADYLPDVKGAALEIVACFAPSSSGATRFGLKLRVSDDGQECVRIWYDPKTDQFGTAGAVTKQTSARGGITRDGSANGPITLRIFLDRSVLEVYCGGAALTSRTFSDPKALGIDLFAEGGSIELPSLDIWQMRSMWDPAGDAAGRTAETMKRFTIPLIDLADDQRRQVVVDREPGQYLGHPTTVLLEDGKTLLCVYPKGHGRGAIVYKRSGDGGRTWSDRLSVPESWATSLEVPTLHRVVDADGKRRLILFSGLYPCRMATSEDDGATWSELRPVGDWGGIVAMGCVVALKTGAGHYMAMFHDDGRFFTKEPRVRSPKVFTLYKTLSADGGLTWSFPEAVHQGSDVYLCEPGAIRSPDGRQLAVLLRENMRRKNSHIMFSDDEGRTWTPPREMPAALSGDRHTGRYGPDGRLLISFRDRSPQGAGSPTEGDWVAWVGTYDDLVRGREGQYRVRLMDNHHGWDCAYPGVEVLPCGTFVVTTYGHWTQGEAPYVVSVRLKLGELDALAEKQRKAAGR